MLTPNQIQDLSVVLNVDFETLSSIYEASDVSLTDEMSIIDVLSSDISERDYSKVRLLLQNYPLFDDILMKMNIIDEVMNIDRKESIHINEFLTESVVKSFEGTPLHKIFVETMSMNGSNEDKNDKIRESIMRIISPVNYMKPIMEGLSVGRKTRLDESTSRFNDKTEKELIQEIRDLRRYISRLPILHGKDGGAIPNPQYQRLREELAELESIYKKRFGGFSIIDEDVIQPIKPIEAQSSTDPEENKEENQDSSNQSTENVDDEDISDLDDPILLQRALADMKPENIPDMYKDMDSDDLSKHLQAIEELLK